MMTTQQYAKANSHLSTLKTPQAIGEYMDKLAHAFPGDDPLFRGLGEQAATMQRIMRASANKR